MVDLEDTKYQPKYLKIEWNGWDYVCSPIMNDEGLKIWLKDGSLQDGDIVYEIKKIYLVRPTKNVKVELVLEEVI